MRVFSLSPAFQRFQMHSRPRGPGDFHYPSLILTRPRGDAAHATTPWLSSGGGMSIEDGLIISSLLGRSKNAAEAVAALKAYDEVRRPRTQRIVESSRVMGWLATGKDEEVGLNAEGIGKKMNGFFDFIHGLDIQGHLDEAIALMDHNLAQRPSVT